MDLDALRPYLSPVAAELLELLGIERFSVLVQKYGGIAVYVPSRSDGDSALAAQTDADTERLLSGRFGGFHLSVPNCRAAIIAWRRDQMLSARANQTGVATAREFGVTERQVRRLKERWGLPESTAPPAQMDLLDP